MPGIRLSHGKALILAGLALLAVSSAFEAQIVLSGGFGSSYLGGGDLIHLLVVPWALGFVFFGFYLDHPEVLWDPRGGRRAAATYLLLTDGAIHFVAIGQHIDLPVVAFFVVLAPAEFVGAWFLLRGSRMYLTAWMGVALFLVALYVASRTVSLPLVTQQMYLFEPMGLLAKMIEGLLVAVLVKDVWATSRAARGAVAGGRATQS